MDKDDARRLGPAEQHERRRRVIRAHKRGRTRTQISEEIGLSYTAVSKVIARYGRGWAHWHIVRAGGVVVKIGR
jgi:hypothetical protein